MPKATNFTEETDPKQVSEESAVDFMWLLDSIVNDRVNKRLHQGDIALCFDAKITAVNNDTITLTTLSIPNVNGGNTDYPVEAEITTSVSAEYDDYVYDNIKNCTGQGLSVGDWVKVCSYDNIKYYAIHVI